MSGNLTEFEILIKTQMRMLKRFLFHKISDTQDAEDILQDVLLSAYNGFDRIKSKEYFKNWIIKIASYKCVDYYKAQAKKLEIPIELIDEGKLDNRGNVTALFINDVLCSLKHKDKQILYLFYIAGYNQKDIAAKLNIPLGTVKSRLSMAKKNFKTTYLNQESIAKGNQFMKTPTIKTTTKTEKFPKIKPKITIEKSNKKPFSVRCEEVSGSLIIPRVGEKIKWAFYDNPDGKYTGFYNYECVREAKIHGIPCVQIEVTEEDESGKITKSTEFMRLTDNHTSYIAEMHIEDGTFNFGSFYDNEYLSRYEMGENNIGREIFQEQSGVAKVDDSGKDMIINFTGDSCTDIIGRFDVRIGSTIYDTVALFEISLDEKNEYDGTVVIHYLDKNGRTVLFRRFNRNDWGSEKFRGNCLWTDKLADSEAIIINGKKYVHWYDCLSDYVL